MKSLTLSETQFLVLPAVPGTNTAQATWEVAIMFAKWVTRETHEWNIKKTWRTGHRGPEGRDRAARC